MAINLRPHFELNTQAIAHSSSIGSISTEIQSPGQITPFSQSMSSSSDITQFSFQEEEVKKQKFTLEHFQLGVNQGITPESLISAMKQFNITLIDCRYSYEYQGGHIEGSINIHKPSVLLDKIFNQNTAFKKDKIFKSNIFVFYCEFSSKRAPEMCHEVRKRDRNINTYPELSFPDIYVLQGGYSQFYELYRNTHCVGQYVKMEAPEFQEQKKIIEKDFLQDWQQFKPSKRGFFN